MVDEQDINQSSQIQPSDSLDLRDDGTCESSTATAPHKEQLRYWDRDLRYKRLTLLISVTGLLISVSGFILIIFTIRANYQQVSINTEQLRINTSQSLRMEKYTRANVQISVLSHVITLDKIFMDKPYLRPYFYEGKLIAEKDKQYQEVSATAELMLDIFDITAAQKRSFPEFWDSPEAWDEWIIDVFSTSPILRDTHVKYANWYDKILTELREKGQQRLEERARQGRN